MATITTGLGGPQGVGEGSFRGSALTAGNYDDGSIRVNITSVFGPQGINYFGTNYTSIYINTNGLITFAGPQTSYIPAALANVTHPAIAAFWTDINIPRAPRTAPTTSIGIWILPRGGSRSPGWACGPIRTRTPRAPTPFRWFCNTPRAAISRST